MSVTATPSGRPKREDELLSVTDESCCDVKDNFLECRINGLEYSPMFFTANDIEKASPILVNRCRVIRFPSANAARLKSIIRKFAREMLKIRIYKNVVESVLGKAMDLDMNSDTDDPVRTTEEMFAEARNKILGTDGRTMGFSA